MLFIVNGAAGSGKAVTKFEKVRELLTERGISYNVVATEYAGHATQLAHDAVKSGESIIVAVGGDGNLRDVASALVGTDVTLGVLPFGTGNDLIKSIGIPADTCAATDCLLRGYVRKMDACRANDRYFLNVAGIGFDVEVLVETERFKKGRLNMLPYILGIFSALMHRKVLCLHIELDDEVIEDEFLMISVANGTHIGGGMKVAPNASPFDGLLDVVLIKNVGLFRFLCLLPTFIKGTHINHHETVTVKHAHRVNISSVSGDELPVQTDGEIDEITPVSFEIMKDALKVIVPEEEHEQG